MLVSFMHKDDNYHTVPEACVYILFFFYVITVPCAESNVQPCYIALSTAAFLMELITFKEYDKVRIMKIQPLWRCLKMNLYYFNIRPSCDPIGVMLLGQWKYTGIQQGGKLLSLAILSQPSVMTFFTNLTYHLSNKNFIYLILEMKDTFVTVFVVMTHDNVDISNFVAVLLLF